MADGWNNGKPARTKDAVGIKYWQPAIPMAGCLDVSNDDAFRYRILVLKPCFTRHLMGSPQSGERPQAGGGA